MGLEERALVVALQLIIVLVAIKIAARAVPWIWRNRARLAEQRAAGIVIGSACLALLFGWESMYYATARVSRAIHGTNMWANEWAYSIATVKILILVSMLVLLAGVRRVVYSHSCEAEARRLIAVLAICVASAAGLAAALW